MISLNIRQLLFRVAQSRFSSIFIGFAFQHLSSLMPLKEKSTDESTVTFAHPSPYWEQHYLIVPKRRVPSFTTMDLQERNSTKHILSIFANAQSLARKNRMQEYSLLVNGGQYQDVPQMHFHLFYGLSKDGVPWGAETYEPPSKESEIFEHQTAYAYHKSNPNREIHYLICSNMMDSDLGNLVTDNEDFTAALLDMLEIAQTLIIRCQLDKYSILTNARLDYNEVGLVLHLVSGSEI